MLHTDWSTAYRCTSLKPESWTSIPVTQNAEPIHMWFSSSKMSHEAWSEGGLMNICIVCVCANAVKDDFTICTQMTTDSNTKSLQVTAVSLLTEEESALVIIIGWSQSKENIIHMTVSFCTNKIVGVGKFFNNTWYYSHSVMYSSHICSTCKTLLQTWIVISKQRSQLKVLTVDMIGFLNMN
jgi:hypothetical protein